MRRITDTALMTLAIAGIAFAAGAQESAEKNDPTENLQYRDLPVERVPIQGNLLSIESKADPIDIQAVEEEIGIMAKVLEDSIDNAGIDDWKAGAKWVGAPTFDFGGISGGGHIRSRYIPTVGVIFTVPIAFPIRSTAKFSDGEDEADVDPPDLWKKHQRSTANYSIRFNKSVTTIDKDGETTIVSKEPVIIEETSVSTDGDESHAEARTVKRVATAVARPDGKVEFNIRSGGISSPGGGIGGGGVGPGTFNPGGGGGGGSVGGFGGVGVGAGGQSFGIAVAGVGDDTVAQLQNGTYLLSHRGDSQPEYSEEKVTKLRTTLLETMAKYGHRMEHLHSDDRVIVIVESGGYGQFPYLEGIPVIGQVKRGAATQDAPFGRSTARFQISVRKRDLTDGTTPEALETQVEKTEY